MIKNKRYVAFALAGVLTLGTTISSQAMVNNKNNDSTNSISIEKQEKIKLEIEDLAYSQDGFLMLPARLTCETLGYNVKWIRKTQSVEISKDNVWTNFALEKDSYLKGNKDDDSREKSTPIPLGIAPQVVNGSTYLPVQFFEELLQENIFDVYEKNKIDGYITDIKHIENNTMLTVTYDNNRKIIFIVGKDTIITNSITNEKMQPKDLEQGDTIVVLHDSMMTRSLPPQTIAYKIDVTKNNIVKGKVSEIKETTKGHHITVKHKNNDTIIFHVNEKTKIINHITKKEAHINDILVGDELILTHTKAFTMSLPPQTTALKIELCSK
jgi:hypothetical protein